MMERLQAKPTGRRAVAVAVLGGALLTGCGEGAQNTDNQKPSEYVSSAPTDRPTTYPKVGRVTLTGGNMCDWKPSSPQPPVKVNQDGTLRAQVDGRCAPPIGSNYIGVYTRPVQNPGDTNKFEAFGPQDVKVDCQELGQIITDSDGISSGRWLHVQATDQQGEAHTGYIPEFGVGYDSVGVPECGGN
jgi:hypothetical protein